MRSLEEEEADTMIVLFFLLANLDLASKIEGFVPYSLYANITLFYNNTTFPLIEPAYTEDGSYQNTENLSSEEEVFDFIVVGSGPAGSVIANRLSEVSSNWTVLLLEIGEEPTILTEIPSIAAYFLFTDYNWGYLTEEQDNMALGLVDKRMHWPRGRVLGGSSVINGLLNVRGNRLDFNRWAENGNKGWSYQSLLPYFKKIEDYHVKIGDQSYHQRGGYLHVEDVPYRSKSAEAFVEAMQELGYRYVDYNGRRQEGVSYIQANTKRGRRCSAFNTLLEPIVSRRNLKISTNSRATKIIMDKSKKQAAGIQYVKNRRYRIAKAKKEVIISAGALNSPQILMLSGIGPADHLHELGIELVQDLPVGRKLYDHLAFFGLTVEVNESITIPFDRIFESYLPLRDYIQGKGVLATLSGVEALGIIRTPLSEDPQSSYPDVELMFFGGSNHIDRGQIFRKTLRITDEIYDAIWKPLEGKPAFTILPMLYHPKSCGYVRLKSKNPYHRPKFYGNYLSDPGNFDVKTFVAAIRFVQDLIQMPALQKYAAKLVDTPVPGCHRHRFDGDDYWECALRHLSSSVHHQVATCKMGPKRDREAVVGDTLKVHGVSRLRVADTSIIPDAITAHTNIPSFMIGEKAADLIKGDWSEGKYTLRMD